MPNPSPTPATPPSLHLLYHELRSTPTPYAYVVPEADFARHLDLFATLRSSPSATRPEITFDDGHLSNYTLALPLLEARNLVARFFITVGWTGERSSYMGWTELRALHAAGQHIGAHGWSHTLLTHCSPDALELELDTARKTLEDHLGTPITSMSLPGGRSNPRVLAACHAAGYTHVYTSVPRAEPLPLGPTVGRLNIRNGTTIEWLADILQPESPTLASLERQNRLKSAAKAVLGDHLYAKLWSLVNREEPDPAANAPAA